ncbi:MAG: transketolase [Bacteroidetes bacterium]|nr:MAG: transketolase [Bacteroidota bacterium]
MIQNLKQKAYKIRKHTLESLYHAGSGHTGGSLGLADIFAVLYFQEMKHQPDNPKWEERDRLILSIGHVAPVHYATLALAGYFPTEELKTLRKLGSRLQGHPGRDFGLEGLELSAGSLGQGLSVAVGMAIAAKHKKENHKIYAIVGDGELQEGSIWEAAMSAAHYNLDNLTLIIDRNGVQIDGSTEDVMSLEPLGKKWEAFGWNVIDCDGNKIDELLSAFDKSKKEPNKPSVIIAKTKMGKGIKEIEGDYKWHGKTPNKKEFDRFITSLKQ